MAPTDPIFALPPGQRGLVVSSSLQQQDEEGSWRVGKYLNPQDLRCGLLFWDRLAWPSPYFTVRIDEAEAAAIQYLETSRVLVRPQYPGALRMSPPSSPLLAPRDSGVFSDLASQGVRRRINALGGSIPEDSDLPGPVLSIALRHLLAFMEADAAAPGAWALANDVSSMLDGKKAQNASARGLLVELFNCIPVPDTEMPLPEVLEFKQRRHDELIRLRAEVENLYLEVRGDNDLALRAAKEKLDRACADAIRVARETRFPFRLSGIKVGFTLPAGTLIGGTLISAWMAQPFSMPTTDMLLAGAVSTLALGWDIVPRAVQPRDAPYRYITSMHSQLL